MRAASSADKLMVSHKAGHELLLLLLPLTDKQTGRAPSPLLAACTPCSIYIMQQLLLSLGAALQHCVAASLAACSSCQPVN